MLREELRQRLLEDRGIYVKEELAGAKNGFAAIPIAGPLFAENCHRCVPRFAIRIRGGFLSHMQELVSMLQKVIDPFIDPPVVKVGGTRHTWALRTIAPEFAANCKYSLR